MWRGFVGWVLLVTCLLPTFTLAQNAREIIQRGKSATAFVELPDKRRSASAVCIHESGIVVTNYHVVKDLPKGSKVKLVFNATEAIPREVEATVVREDAEADLAILRVVKSDQTFPFLPLGNDSELFETMKVTTFGFPFGKALAVSGQRYPDISVIQGQVTALRMRDGKLMTVQLDAQLNPGNSGGPTVDETGAIVGIVHAGVLGAGVNFAIPVRGLRPLVEVPEILFDAPRISLDSRNKPIEFQVELVSILNSTEGAAVELEIREIGKPTRKFAAKPQGKNRFAFSFIPLLSKDESSRVWIPGTLTFSNGSIQASFEDETIQVGNQSFQLAQLRSIDWGSNHVVPEGGSEIVNIIKGPSKLKVSLGSSVFQIDLADASRLELKPSSQTEPAVDYSLIVKKGGSELLRRQGQWLITSESQTTAQAADETQSFSLNGVNMGTYTYIANGKTRPRYMGGGLGMNTVDVQQDMDTIWGQGNTSVTGPNGGPWKVQFKGALAGTDIPQMSINFQGIPGPNRVLLAPSFTTIANGGKKLK